MDNAAIPFGAASPWGTICRETWEVTTDTATPFCASSQKSLWEHRHRSICSTFVRPSWLFFGILLHYKPVNVFIRGLPVLCFLFPLTCLEKHFVKLQYKKCLPTLTLAEKKANLLHVILHVSLCISVIMCVGGLAVSWHHVNSISIICIWSFLLAIFCFFYISTIFLYACTPHHPHLCESVSACVYVCVCVCMLQWLMSLGECLWAEIRCNKI